MTKKEIIKRIAERGQMTQLRSREILQWILDMVSDSLADEGRVELRNFGVFEVKIRKGRKARNPRTNEIIDIEPKKVVTFTAGQEMLERVKRYRPRRFESSQPPVPPPAPVPPIEPQAPAAVVENPPSVPVVVPV